MSKRKKRVVPTLDQVLPDWREATQRQVTTAMARVEKEQAILSALNRLEDEMVKFRNLIKELGLELSAIDVEIALNDTILPKEVVDAVRGEIDPYREPLHLQKVISKVEPALLFPENGTQTPGIGAKRKGGKRSKYSIKGIFPLVNPIMHLAFDQQTEEAYPCKLSTALVWAYSDKWEERKIWNKRVAPKTFIDDLNLLGTKGVILTGIADAFQSLSQYKEELLLRKPVKTPVPATVKNLYANIRFAEHVDAIRDTLVRWEEDYKVVVKENLSFPAARNL